MLNPQFQRARSYRDIEIALSQHSVKLSDKLDKKKYPLDSRELSGKIVKDMASNPRVYYRSFTIPKKSGGSRLIEAPNRKLKLLHWAILDQLEDVYEVPSYVHGFAPEKGIKTNALPHVGKDYILNVDIRNFFHSIKKDVIESYLNRELGFSKFATRVTGRLVTLRGSLPMGAPTSPLLSNLLFQKADEKISALSEQLGVTYTRYADDMTFSSGYKSGVLEIKHHLFKLLLDEGFEMLNSKTRILRPCQSQRVTGVVVNEKLNVPRKFRRKTRAMQHRLNVAMKMTNGNKYEALILASEHHAEMNGFESTTPEQWERQLKGREAFEKMIKSRPNEYFSENKG